MTPPRQMNARVEDAFPEQDRLDLFRATMRSIVRKHGLQYFIVLNFPEADKAGLLENLIISNWPQELLGKYERADMFRESRIVAGLKRTILPICSDTLLFARARDGVKSEVLGIFYDDGFANTIGLSLHDAPRTHYLMMLSGSRRITSEDELAILLLAVMKALDAATVFEPQEKILSPRILDCLRWSAAGKSSEEIAVILNLSSHTVNDYLRMAMEKLNAVSRTQAVAIACRLRLI